MVESIYLLIVGVFPASIFNYHPEKERNDTQEKPCLWSRFRPLGFHPDHIRRGLMAWKEVGRKMVAAPEAKKQRPAKMKRTRYLPRAYQGRLIA